MAEAIAISISAKLVVALSRSASLSLSSLFAVRSDISAAVQDLDLLRAFLRFVDSNHTTDAHAVSWVRQVRDASFELEDAADECCYLCGNGSAWGWVNVRAWFVLSRRLRKARERLNQLSAAKELYGIRHADGAARPVIATRQMLAESAHFVQKEEIVGFAAHEQQLLKWVVEDADTRRMQVAVWGMGGVGKTTLVTRVYKEVVASHFDCAAWVVVSQGFTMDNLLGKILKELQVKRNEDTGYRSLIAAIRDHLRERRYLLVLDDIWDAHLWDKLRHAFPDDTNRSRVVITTRSRDVAKAAAPERTMILEPLPWREAWALFCNTAFRGVSSRTCPSHLVELAANVVKRCRGLPLAIISIGNLLALKERTELAWKNVRDSLVWDGSSSDLGIGEAASILNLSIDDLPHYLKKCFLSCSIYAEDFLIKRKILIRNWVAQGFVDDNPSQHAAEPEDVADDYLDQLVQRSLMQVIERNEFGRAKRCLIHDLIRDLIIHRSREEEGFFQFTNCRITIGCNVRIRHLAVDRCEMGSQTVPNQASLRSFHAFGSEFDALFLSRFRLLTVPNLWFVETEKLPDSVTSLHNLRYLGIRSTLIKSLPKDLGKLQKLQTLDAKLSMVQRLPRSAAKLKSLRHLILFKRQDADFRRPFPCTVVAAPEGLENLTSLQTLKYVRADKKMVRSLARLEQMRSLELSGVDASHTADFSSSICRMSCLVRLGLHTEPGEDAVLDLESIRQPPLKLRKLALSGKLAGGNLPSWIRSLNSLVHLRLCRCDIGQDSLVLLGALPGLVNLSLIAAYHDRAITFVRGSFPILQELTLLDLPNLRYIEFQQGCLVKLRDLVLRECTELAEAPHGMENLKHIHNLEIFGMPTKFSDKLKEQNSGAGNFCSRYLGWVGRNK